MSPRAMAIQRRKMRHARMSTSFRITAASRLISTNDTDRIQASKMDRLSAHWSFGVLPRLKVNAAFSLALTVIFPCVLHASGLLTQHGIVHSACQKRGLTEAVAIG